MRCGAARGVSHIAAHSDRNADATQTDLERIVQLDIDVASLHDTEYHLERQYHDDVRIKFIDVHDNILCDAMMSEAIAEKVPCLIDMNLLRNGDNTMLAKVYLQSTGQTIERFELNVQIDLGVHAPYANPEWHRSKSVENLQSILLQCMAAIGLFGAGMLFRDPIYRGLMIETSQENMFKKIVDVLDLNSKNADSTTQAKGGNLSGLMNGMQSAGQLNRSRHFRPSKTRQFAARVGALGAMYFGSILAARPQESEDDMGKVIVVPEKEGRDPDREQIVGMIAVTLGAALAILTKRRPPVKPIGGIVSPPRLLPPLPPPKIPLAATPPPRSTLMRSLPPARVSPHAHHIQPIPPPSNTRKWWTSILEYLRGREIMI